MELPCSKCKFRIIRKQGCRTYVGCSDIERKKGFIEDTAFYQHRCSNFKEGDILK